MAIIKEEFDGTPRYKCEDCNEWAYISRGGVIRHSSRCDTPKAQFIEPKANRPPSPVIPVSGLRRDDAIQNMTDDGRFDAYKRGDVSQSEAMNTDF